MNRSLMFCPLLLGSLTVGALPATAFAQRAVQAVPVSTLDSVVRQAMAARQIVGTSVAVARGGRVLVAKGYGYADLENEVPATERTVYRVGSVTKQFTAAGIMLLVESGKISLTDELTRFLPDYQVKGHRVTVDQLLTHTSGIKGYTEMPVFWEQSRLDLTHDQMIKMFSAEPFEFSPGERYQYNNSAYYLLGVIIEKVSGDSYTDFLKARLLDPVGLSQTYYLDEGPIVKHRARGYEVRNGQVVNADPLSMKLPYAAGSLGSTVLDLIKWKAALVRGQVVSSDSYQRMILPAPLNDGQQTTYGYGLAIGSVEGKKKISHGGGINGFRAQLAYYPDDDLTIAVLCNTGSANPEVLESRVARLFMGLPEPDIREVPLRAQQLSRYAGTYHPGRAPFRVAVQDGGLVLFGNRLRHIGNHTFVPVDDPYQRVTFRVEGDSVMELTTEREGHRTVARRVTP